MLESAVSSRVSPHKKDNDDAFLSEPDVGVFAIADGLGSCSDPSGASRLAIDEVRRRLLCKPTCRSDCETQRWLVDVVQHCNDVLFRGRQEGNHWLSTLTAMVVEGTRVILAHCGDSRAYLWQHNRLTQLTHDHTMVAELVDAGHLANEDARDHPRRNILSSCLGLREKVRIDSLAVPIDEGWVLMLCSDGVSSAVDFDGLGACIATAASSSLKQIAAALVEKAGESERADDATALLVRARRAN